MSGRHQRKGHLVQHRDSSQLEDILNPVRSLRDAQRRAGIQPVDHHKQNLSAIKACSRRNKLARQKEQEEEAHRVAQQAAGFKAVPLPNTSNPSSTCSTPRRMSTDGSVDCVHANIVDTTIGSTSARQRREQKQDEASAWTMKGDYGRVPLYLKNIKLDLAAQRIAKQLEREAALIPPGMRIMHDEERLHRLQSLEAEKRGIEAQLAAMPLRLELPSQRRHTAGLEDRLRAIDEESTTLMRPRMFVKAGSSTESLEEELQHL